MRSSSEDPFSNVDIQQDQTILLDTGRFGWVWAVAFHPDGEHVLGGNEDGIRRWRLADGLEVGKQTGMVVQAISVSSDNKWIVCGTDDAGASVWDGKLQEKVIDVEGESTVDAVEVSPDSTRFATGTRTKQASIWSITTGQRLVGPLEHDDWVTGVRFSPNGERIATACPEIRIFDSRTGDKLVAINGLTLGFGAATPIAWSSDGQHIFTASSDKNIKAFDACTGTQLAESDILHGANGDYGLPIALATNGKVIAACTYYSISLLDASTLARIGPAIVGNDAIWSIAISPDRTRLATGQREGKIVIRDLAKILPESYGPINVSICALPRSVPNVDKLCRYLLRKKLNQRSSPGTTSVKDLAPPQ